MFGYCFYYYLARSDMSGFMQTSFFFGYMLMVCYAFFLMLGAVGYKSSLVFVRHIYRQVRLAEQARVLSMPESLPESWRVPIASSCAVCRS